MPTPATPVSEPDPSALIYIGDQAGLCAVCHRKTHRYGHGGCPLCQLVPRTGAGALGPSVRYVNTRTKRD
ncbi:hypothetical protein ACFQ6E_39475 [Streptomyces sp. NPDC056462]|uniref:hypothetical protein n=1 Tax=Streptomyces sp. NPDC056462 TaxID=3345826 RepID=UPI0036A7E813